MWYKKRSVEKGAKAVAYYRHSAEDRQEYSVPIQREQVRKFAEEHGIEIVKEFADHGKSGLSTKGRDEFREMLQMVTEGNVDFDYVLALDVTRWGRFQDVILSAYYMGLCQQFGKKVVFTAFGDIPKEDDLLHYMRLSVEGFMAASYSRELSEKVFKGCVNIAEHGWRAGGPAPYGLRRLLLDEKGRSVQVLKRGQRKSIQNQRVTLTPGDKNEVRIVRQMFTDLVAKQQLPRDIAGELNKNGIPSPGNRRWTSSSILSILRNESYVGTMIYNKTSQKLQSATTRNPRDAWVRVEGAFRGIVNKELFSQAQRILEARERERRYDYSDEAMLEKLRRLYEYLGIVTSRQIRRVADMPSPSTYAKHFLSLDGAFQSLFPETLDSARRAVTEQLKASVGQVEEFKDYLVLKDSLSIVIQPSVPIPFGYGTYWSFLPDPRIEVDVTLGVPLSDCEKCNILGYLMFPRLLVESRIIRLFSSSDSKLDLHGYRNLTVVKSLLF